jgi:excisionase family DNA binding protein
MFAIPNGEARESFARCPSAATRVVSLRDAERETGIPKDTLRKMIDAGTLPVVEIPGVRRVWLDRDLLNAAIDGWIVRRS